MTDESNEKVKVRLYAAARARVGMSEVLSWPGTAKEILEELAKNDFATLSLFSRCSILLQGEQLHDRETFIQGGSEIDILPPFAGGGY
jgi:molybdopterin converting factor small subunit